MNTNENDSVAEEDVPLYAAARFAYKVANGEFTSSWGMHPELIALSLQFVSWFERTQQRPFGDDSYLLKEHALSFSPTVKKQLKRLKKRRSTKSRKSEKPLKTDARKETTIKKRQSCSLLQPNKRERIYSGTCFCGTCSPLYIREKGRSEISPEKKGHE